MIEAPEALRHLQEGNHRFATGVTATHPLAHHARRSALTDRREPFAIVLGCSTRASRPRSSSTRALAISSSSGVNHLRYGSDILQAFIRQRKLLVVGAEYSLETGRVDFFHGLEGATSVVQSTP
jgi:carbonic anhydrase